MSGTAMTTGAQAYHPGVLLKVVLLDYTWASRLSEVLPELAVIAVKRFKTHQ